MEFVPDQKVLVKCVQKVEGLTDCAAIQIRRTVIEDNVPIHTNNTCKVVKARIEYQHCSHTKTTALVIKVPFLRSKIIHDTMQSLRFFDKEAQFYQSIAPRLQELLLAKVAPTLLAVDEQQVLYMDDLSARGFRIQVNGRLDAEHSRVALQHLARMHAASHALYRQDPHCMDELTKRQFLFGDDFIGGLYEEVKPLLEALVRQRCLSAETVARFGLAARKAPSNVAGNLDSDRFNLKVLNHGDLKAFNIMFEHDEQCRPVQCRFIDFQNCHWSSPAADIVFVTIQSVERQVFANNFECLLHSYVSTLNSTLEKLNCDVRLTEAQLKRDMDELKAFKVSSFLFRTTIDIREFSKNFNYGKSETACPELIDKFSQSCEIQENVRFWLEEFVKSGVI